MHCAANNGGVPIPSYAITSTGDNCLTGAIATDVADLAQQLGLPTQIDACC